MGVLLRFIHAGHVAGEHHRPHPGEHRGDSLCFTAESAARLVGPEGRADAGAMSVRHEDRRRFAGCRFCGRTVEVAGDEQAGQALEGDILDSVTIVPPWATKSRLEGCPPRQTRQAGATQNSFADLGGPFPPGDAVGPGLRILRQFVPRRFLGPGLALAQRGNGFGWVSGQLKRKADRGGAEHNQSGEADEELLHSWCEYDTALVPRRYRIAGPRQCACGSVRSNAECCEPDPPAFANDTDHRPMACAQEHQGYLRPAA